MFTRCQGCHTVHPVNAELLGRAGGRFRCGKCRKVGNALDALFDHWPDAGEVPPGPGSLPELGAPLSLDEPDDETATPEEAALLREMDAPAEVADRASRRLLRVVWVTAAFVVVVIAGLNVARYFDYPLLDHPRVQQTLERTGLKEPPPAPPFRAPDRIEIVSREMIAHPHRPTVLLLSATIVSRAERQQPYPDIGVTLLSADSRVLARHRYAPGEYLTRTAELRQGMTPGAYVRLELDIPDPGEQAVGFELEFF